METFEKEAKFVKLLRELKPALVSYNKKKFTGFSHMFVILNLLCFGALLRDNLLMGAWCLRIVIYI